MNDATKSFKLIVFFKHSKQVLKNKRTIVLFVRLNFYGSTHTKSLD